MDPEELPMIIIAHLDDEEDPNNTNNPNPNGLIIPGPVAPNANYHYTDDPEIQKFTRYLHSKVEEDESESFSDEDEEDYNHHYHRLSNFYSKLKNNLDAGKPVLVGNQSLQDLLSYYRPKDQDGQAQQGESLPSPAVPQTVDTSTPINVDNQEGFDQSVPDVPLSAPKPAVHNPVPVPIPKSRKLSKACPKSVQLKRQRMLESLAQNQNLPEDPLALPAPVQMKMIVPNVIQTEPIYNGSPAPVPKMAQLLKLNGTINQNSNSIRPTFFLNQMQSMDIPMPPNHLTPSPSPEPLPNIIRPILKWVQSPMIVYDPSPSTERIPRVSFSNTKTIRKFNPDTEAMDGHGGSSRSQSLSSEDIFVNSNNLGLGSGSGSQSQAQQRPFSSKIQEIYYVAGVPSDLEIEYVEDYTQ